MQRALTMAAEDSLMEERRQWQTLLEGLPNADKLVARAIYRGATVKDFHTLLEDSLFYQLLAEALWNMTSGWCHKRGIHSEDAIIETFLAICARMWHFDPTRGTPLWAFLSKSLRKAYDYESQDQEWQTTAVLESDWESLTTTDEEDDHDPLLGQLMGYPTSVEDIVIIQDLITKLQEYVALKHPRLAAKVVLFFEDPDSLDKVTRHRLRRLLQEALWNLEVIKRW